MPKKQMIRRRGRRLTAPGNLRSFTPKAVAAKVLVDGATALYQASKTSKGLRGFKRNQRYTASNVSMLRSNDSGYIKPHSFKLGYPKKSLSMADKIQKVLNPQQVFQYNDNGKIEVSSGRQNVSGFVIQNTDLNQIFAEYPNLRTESATANTAYSGTANMNQLLHNFTSITHTFINSSNLAAELQIYTYVSKLDVLSSQQFLSPVACWQYAENNNSLNGGSGTVDAGIGANALGKKPTDISSRAVIGRYWNLINKCSVTMKAGESFKHYGIHYVNKLLRYAFLNADNTGVTARHSLGMIFILRGQVVGSSLNTDVSTGDGQLSYIRTRKMGFSTVNQSRPRDNIITNNIPQIAAANQIFINTDTSTQTTAFVEDA